MTVGIRLNYRQGARAADFTGQLVVVTQGVEVDQGAGRTRYNAATIIISTSTSGLYIFASTHARAGAAPGATQASQT